MAANTENFVRLLDNWLEAEDQTIAMTNQISESTPNPTIRIFMTAIRADSVKHKLIQQFLKSALTEQAPALSFDEIARVSGMINDHLALEQKTVDIGTEMAADMKLPVLKELLQYLLEDERKHVALLNALAALKEAAQKNT